MIAKKLLAAMGFRLEPQWKGLSVKRGLGVCFMYCDQPTESVELELNGIAWSTDHQHRLASFKSGFVLLSGLLGKNGFKIHGFEWYKEKEPGSYWAENVFLGCMNAEEAMLKAEMMDLGKDGCHEI